MVEPLEILLPFGIGPGQRDLGDLPHLRRPAPERLDELAEGERPCRLVPEPVIMGLLHGHLYYRPCAAISRGQPGIGAALDPGMRRLKAAAGLCVAALTLVVLASAVHPAASAGERPLQYLGGEVGTLDPAYISDATDVQLPPAAVHRADPHCRGRLGLRLAGR